MEDTLLYSLSGALFVILTIKLLLQRKQYNNLPPSPPALPIIGNFHLLRKPLHRTLSNLSQKYGPIFSLRLGSRLAIVVSSPSAVEECFTKNDLVLANRPESISGKYLTEKYRMVSNISYGDSWRYLRRIGALEIFSSNRLNTFLDTRREEVKILLRKLYRVSGHDFAKVEMRSTFTELTYNIIMRFAAGKRYYGEEVEELEEARKFRETIHEMMEISEVADPGDFFPILRWVSWKLAKRAKKINIEADVLLQGLIDEQRSGHGDSETRNNMINRLLSLQEKEPQNCTDDIIKGLILVIIIAGTDTTPVTLEWALSNLLNHPDVLKKAKAELVAQVGRERLMDESDLPKLPYLQAIISETLRLYPVAPLLVPHVPSENCTIGGYNVPQGTMLMTNAWAIHRDPKLWDDPTCFKPERFENEEIGTYKLLPFGMGRRACPGEGFANRVIGLTLGSLIQCFEWKRVNEKEVDMTEGSGFTIPKVQPLEAMCKPYSFTSKILSLSEAT